ncbi:MAG: sugar O-acetyltransferase [Christiangramia sp.]|nr:maltose O-acetyltransferase [Christiangramia sp.]|tara:strand:- start:20 stop:634 length:615 start_codon:yes stop_codon:yes gene_type:complete
MKTEKEKMLAGEAYIAVGRKGEELFKERQFAKELLFQFNNLPPSEIRERNEILKKLLGKTGKNFYFEPPFRCDYGYNIEIGRNFYSNYNLTVLDCASVKIGDNVMLGPNVQLYTAGHPIHHEKRNELWEYAKPIKIGNNVWIGGNTVINPDVTIGDNVVIGAGSVVTRNIPANVIALGNTCKVYREITEDDKKYFYKNSEFPTE